MAILSGIFGLRLIIPLGFGAGSRRTCRSTVFNVALLLFLGFQGGFLVRPARASAAARSRSPSSSPWRA